MPEIKICGLGSAADISEACQLGAAFIGFIFYKQSPRYIAPEKIAEICQGTGLDGRRIAEGSRTLR